MSNDAPEWFKTQYNDRVFHVFQARGFRLRPTVTPAMRIDGEKAIFLKAGAGSARKKTRGQRAVPMNAERKKVESILETWEAFDTVEEYDLDRMGANEREVVAQTGAMALGRAVDAEILGALDTAAPTSGSQFVDQTGNAFSIVHAMTMCQRLQKSMKGVWDGNVYCPLPSLLWNQLLAAKQVNSSDHVGSDIPFVKATDTRFWNGVNWFLFSDDYFDDQLVKAANNYDVLLYHRDAAGWGNHTEVRSIWDWDNYESWWTVNMQSKGSDVILHEEGIIRGRFSSTAAITLT